MDPRELTRPWLVAAWPGMGGVAQIAVDHLIRHLGAVEVERVVAPPGAGARSIAVRAGLVVRAQPSIGRLFAWRDPDGRRDLLLFAGERQSDADGAASCEALVAAVRRRGVERVFTFAAMAADLRPGDEPAVQVAATSPALLAALREHGAVRLDEGEVAGMNGLLVGVAAERGLESACLLGGLPFFAAGIPNPRAARAILRRFADFAGLSVPLDELDASVRDVESQLVEQLESLRRASESGVTSEPAEAPDDDRLPRDVAARIEALFAVVGGDRARAGELKALLDRHGVFRRYEDRFLDLFRRAD